MASKETQVLDNIIASRRALLVGGGAALAALAMPKAADAASTVTAYTDNDILNFALNLEYLEANFYYLAAFGTNIYTANAASTAAGAAVLGITGTGTQGVVLAKASPAVPFALPAVKSYAIETAIEEGKHVSFLRANITSPVAQPQIDLTGGSTYGTTAAWNALAAAAGIPAAFQPFDPFASDATFLVAAYVFEDVGVTAYHGAAPLITSKTILGAASSILAVEAYHAGLVRTTINLLDPANTAGYIGLTQNISALRTKLAKAVAVSSTTPPYSYPTTGTYGDDTPLTTGTTVSLAGASSVTATTTVDADLTNVIAFSRTTTEVLNIVTGGGAGTTGTKATGVFFPAGLNGLFT